MIGRHLELGRLLIYKIDDNLFKIITSGGSIFKLSKTKVLNILSFAGKLFDEIKLLEVSEREEVKKYIKLGILFWETKEKGALYDYKQIIENVKGFDSGACSLSNILISVTNQCNYSCVFCYRKEMVLDDWNSDESVCSVISDAKKFGAVAIGFTGGNPPEKWEKVGLYAQKALSLKYDMIKVSLKIDTINPKIIEYWNDSGVNLFRVSIDDFVLTEGLNELVRICVKKNIKLEFAYTVYNRTYNLSNEKFWKYLHRFNIPLIISPYVPVTHAINEDVTLYKQLIKEVELHAKTYSCEVRGGGIFSAEKNTFFCNAGLCYCYVESDGRVSGCPLLTKEKMEGYLTEKSFFEIWKDSKWKFYRDIDEYTKLECNSCNKKNDCVGFCKAMILSKEWTCKEKSMYEKKI